MTDFAPSTVAGLGDICLDPPARISVVIPVLNEQQQLKSCLARLQPFRDRGHEIIVVDGGSSDATVEIAASGNAKVLRTDRGRARQMNAAAAVARGNLLLFLHGDTVLPTNAVDAFEGLPSINQWGRFDVDLGPRFVFRVIAWFINQRSRWTQIATGDQAIFVSRDLFDTVGGYPDIPLMEDVALSKALKRETPARCLRLKVKTSNRRWREKGVIATVLLMWRLRFSYWLGADPVHLARRYYGG